MPKGLETKASTKRVRRYQSDSNSDSADDEIDESPKRPRTRSQARKKAKTKNQVIPLNPFSGRSNVLPYSDTGAQLLASAEYDRSAMANIHEKRLLKGKTANCTPESKHQLNPKAEERNHEQILRDWLS